MNTACVGNGARGCDASYTMIDYLVRLVANSCGTDGEAVRPVVVVQRIEVRTVEVEVATVVRTVRRR